MPTKVARAALIALCAAGFPLLSACSSDDDIDLATYVEQTEPADVLYNQGLANLEQGRLKEAGKKFEAVDRQHPYSEQARKSMVMGAFAQYRQGNYDDAINTAKRYVTLYPTNPDAAYAQYIVGLSYYRQIRDVTQDQKPARQTIEAMDELVQRWPELRICRGRQGQDPLRPRPARRQGDADRPLLSGTPRIYRCDQALPQCRRELFQHPPGRGSAVAPDRSLLRDGPYRRGADGRGGARQQLSRQPVVQGFLRAAAKRRAGAARELRGSWLSKAGKILGT